MATRLDDGRILVVGGHVPAMSNSLPTEIWDPDSEHWTELPAAPADTHVGDMVALSRRRALIFGQSRLDGCLVFVFENGSWARRLEQARSNCVDYAHRISDRDIVAVTRAGCVYHLEPDRVP